MTKRGGDVPVVYGDDDFVGVDAATRRLRESTAAMLVANGLVLVRRIATPLEQVVDLLESGVGRVKTLYSDADPAQLAELDRATQNARAALALALTAARRLARLSQSWPARPEDAAVAVDRLLGQP